MGKYYDTSSVMQVLGGIYVKPEILDMEDKYYFLKEDFSGSDFHRILFKSMYNLHNHGTKSFTPAAIEDYLSSRPEEHAIYKANNGAEYLIKLKNSVQISAFDYYYSRIKKMTLLREYSKIMDLSKWYDDDNIFDTKKRQRQEEWLDSSSLQSIADEIDVTVTKIRMNYVEQSGEDFSHAGDGLDALLESLKDSPEFGYPLFGDIMNSIHRGARLTKMYIRSAATGVGKAIPNNSLVPTPHGWSKVKDVKVGDFLIGDDGKATKVLAIYPQESKKQIWNVKFKSGRVAQCCGDHLWGYYADGDLTALQVKSIKDIYLEDYSTYCIPVAEVSEFVDSDIIIDVSKCKTHIPHEYIFASVAQRKILLNELIKENDNYFEAKTEQLKEDFFSLIGSLGILGYCEGTKIHLTDNKVDYIEEISLTNEETEMTCFTVDNNSHLFIMGTQWIVTHNTRALAADACVIGCDKMYDIEKEEWISLGMAEPVLFIATEQDETEIQTLLLAFISGVDENTILTNMYVGDEEDRVRMAAEVIKRSGIQIKKLPDFSLQDVENSIKFSIREYGTRFIFFDYIHTSMKILEEIGRKSAVKNIREDNILFLMSARLKDICNKYDVFIMSATQLNGSFQTADEYNQNLLRGAKSIADKIDCGMIMLDATEQDREELQPLVTRLGTKMPNLKISVYKNRRGKYSNVLVWVDADKGRCRFTPLFVTNYKKEVIPIDRVKIEVNNNEV